MREDRKTLVLETRRIGIRLEMLTDQIMARKGLSAAQGHILLFVLGHSREGTSLTEIHQEFGYSMASLSGILKRLRKSGYVRVEPCLEDNRRKLLFCTEQAVELEQFLTQSISSTCDQAYQDFSDSELEQLDRLQKKVMRNLSLAADPSAQSKESEQSEESPRTVKAV